MQNKIADEGCLRKYYATIPHLVDDNSLTPYAYRLYGHIKRVAGDGGDCFQSTTTLAKACNISTGSVSKAKQELVQAGLIRIEKVRGKSGDYDNITITDVWVNNMIHCQKLSSNNKSVHHMNAQRSPGETKNNTSLRKHRESLKDDKTKSGETSQDDDKTQQWLAELEKNKPPQLKRDPIITSEDARARVGQALGKHAQRQVDNTEIENFLVKLPERVRPIARVFCEHFGRPPIKKENSYWRTEWEAQADLSLFPKHIAIAINHMVEKGLHIKSPASVTSIAEGFKRESATKAPGAGVTQVWKGGERIK